jgi:hypothetical protein
VNSEALGSEHTVSERERNQGGSKTVALQGFRLMNPKGGLVNEESACHKEWRIAPKVVPSWGSAMLLISAIWSHFWLSGNVS